MNAINEPPRRYPTRAELKRQQRAITRAELKQIEARLHPCPTIDGLDILHEHRGQKILFSAWRNDLRANSREVVLRRTDVLLYEEPYTMFSSEFDWLVKGVEGEL